MKTIDLMVCSDCLPVIVNGDASHLDYYYTDEDAQKRMEEIEQGIKEYSEHGYYLAGGDSETYEEFSTSSCDCCGGKLYGSRYHVVGIKR